MPLAKTVAYPRKEGENNSMEENENEKEDENIVDESSENGTFKQWIQDNLRIIISIIIVVSIAGGIYSYSKRSADDSMTNTQGMEQVADETATQDNGTTAVTKDTTTTTDKSNVQTKKDTQVAAAPASQETEGSFVETAGKGEGMTHLARRALSNYLEKNSDSELTVEHKIYIEDYLRKHVAKKGIHVGTTAEFSKSLVAEAITKSKTLNEKQLQNLHKYALRTPSLN